MLDVHPPHEATHTWKDFFIHIATIVVGLIIAVGLEQTVEYLHQRHQAHEAIENIQREVGSDTKILKDNIQSFADSQRQLTGDLDSLDSSAPDTAVLARLDYTWKLGKPEAGAWQAAKLNGSLALIPPAKIVGATYVYESTGDITPTLFSYFADIDSAAALVEHARTAGKLAAPERQQLVSLTISAIGYARLISSIYTYQEHVFESERLRWQQKDP